MVNLVYMLGDLITIQELRLAVRASNRLNQSRSAESSERGVITFVVWGGI
jgi:hypothetical protein